MGMDHTVNVGACAVEGSVKRDSWRRLPSALQKFQVHRGLYDVLRKSLVEVLERSNPECVFVWHPNADMASHSTFAPLASKNPSRNGYLERHFLTDHPA